MAIASLGCKVNQCDGAEIGRGLGALGGVPGPFGSAVDIYVINTCSVTQKSDYQSRQLIRRAARYNPGAVIVVTGCYATRAPGELAGLPGVQLVIGNENKAELPAVIGEKFLDRSGFPLGPLREESETGDIYPSLPGHTRAFVKIQDGCNSSCTYCVVPSVRGACRSVPLEEVKRQLTHLGRAGYQEAILTGIHLGKYGEDLSPAVSLRELIAWADKERPVTRIRLSSLEPTEIPDEIVSYMQTGGILCPHLHIPLQSGDDGILAAMGRPYDAGFFRRRLRELFAALPEIAIGLDVMVGFPWEDEEAFLRTAELIRELPIAYLHVFPFSRRPGTPAAVMTGQVAEKIKKDRAAVLRACGEEKKKRYALGFIGRKLSVLIYESKENIMSGIAANYLPVTINGGLPRQVNSIIDVVAERYSAGFVRGQIL